MSFRITGLPANDFSYLFSLDDAELATLGAVRQTAQHGAPCRVSLTDATPGDEVILVNYEHHKVDSPYRMRFAIYVRRGEETYDKVDEVPEQLRNEELIDLTEWLGELVRQTDSSLLDEWEQLTHPDGPAAGAQAALDAPPRAVTANPRAFRVLVRNAVFRRVALAARRAWATLDELDPEVGWADALEGYFAEHDEVGTGPDARGPALFRVTERGRRWEVRQVLDDPAGDHDWVLDAEVDLDASDEADEAVLAVTAVHRL